MRIKTLMALLVMAFAVVAMPVEAKSKKTKKKEAEAAAKAKAEEDAKKKAEAEKPDLDRPGLFRVQKKKGDWFMLVPDSMLGKDMLTTTRYVSTPSNTGQFGGEECNEQVVYFETNNDSILLLRVRMVVNVSDSTNNINKAVTISNENPIIAMFKPENHKDNAYKIKLNGFLNEDNALGIHNSLRKGFELGAPQPQLSYIDDIKSFPTNTEIRLVKTYNSGNKSVPASAETGKMTFVLNISFIMLPEVPMAARHYDPRVGYFTVGYTSYSDAQQRTESKRFVSRWRLEPKPEDVEKMRRGELVEPQKPIVYYIDPATPKQWRKYLIMGVNDWQKAFEKAGFKNAIRGEEWPEDADSTMSMEDARYSVIRYLASPIANAYGPHVSDPRTGEIMESHICWYHNVMSLVHDWYMVQASSIDEAARKMNYSEELMGQLIRFVSSHEVGHTLGLRHNFGSSSTVPVDSLRNKAWVEKNGHTPSIMDYARFNYVAQPEDGISHEGIFPRINDYDLWAIEWGYTPMLDAKTSLEDYEQLEKLFEKEKVASRPRLWWGDGEASQDDPRRQTEDLGDDAVKASEYGIRNLKRQIVNLKEWTYDSKDIYDENVSMMYNEIVSQFMRYIGHVSKNIGGQLETFRTNKQEGDVYSPQPRAKQKAALDFINRQVLNEPTWIRNVSYAKRMTADPQTLTFSVGRYAVNRLVSRASRLNAEYKADEYLADLTRLIVTGSGRYREELQLAYVEALIGEFRSLSTRSAARPHVLRTLKQLQSRFASGTAHQQMLKDIIDRALVVK